MDTLQSPAGTVCPHCGNPSRTSDYCSNCSRRIAAGPVQVSSVRLPDAALPGEELASLLSMLAGIILVMGLLFAAFVWGHYGTVSSGGFFGGEVSVSNPFAKVGAFAIAANSVIWSALLAGVSRAVRNTIELAGQIAELRPKG